MKTFVQFGKDYTGTKSLSENNSIINVLRVKGVNSNSNSLPEVSINGIQLNATHNPGLNFCVIENNKLKDYKNFDPSFALGVQDFKNYLLKFKTELILIYSYDSINPCKEFDDLMIELGSVSWKGNLLRRYKASYSAVYRADLAQICLEGLIFEDKEAACELELVYDDITDIGVTGVPRTSIVDPNEYEVTTNKKWPKEGSMFPLSSYNLKPNDEVLLSCELFGSQELKTLGGWAILECRWLYNNNWVATTALENTLIGKYPSQSMRYPDKWEQKYVYAKIPENANSFIIVGQKYENIEGLSKFRNLVLTKATFESTDKPNRQIGINGIRTKVFIEEDVFVEDYENPSLLGLQNKSGYTKSVQLKEKID